MVENGFFDKRKRKAKTKTKKKLKKKHKVDNGLSDKEKRKEQKNKLLQFPRWSPICILWLALTLWGSQYCKRKKKTRLPIWICNGKVKTLPYSFETVDGSCATSSNWNVQIHCGLYRQTVAESAMLTDVEKQETAIFDNLIGSMNARWLWSVCYSCLLLGNGNLNPLASKASLKGWNKSYVSVWLENVHAL